MKRGPVLEPGAKDETPERFKDNDAVFEAWLEYQRTRLNDTTLRGYRYEVKQYLDALVKPVFEYGQQDLWTYLDYYLSRCRHHQWGGFNAKDSRGVCVKKADLGLCGKDTCPLFEVRAKATVERHLQAIVTLHDFLVRRGLMPYSYARDVKREYRRENRIQRVRARYLPSKDEVRTLMETSSMPNRRFLYGLLAKTGLRIREAMYLRYDAEHFNLEGGWIKVPEFNGKRKGNRLIVIDDELRRILEPYLRWRQRRARCETLFITQYGHAWDPDNDRMLRLGVRRDLRGAGITGRLTFHCFRHFFSHNLKINGIDGYWWNILRGDIPKGNEATYVHPTPEQIRGQYLRYAPRVGPI